MGPIKRKRTPSGLIDIPYEESARADADGHRLYSMAQRLEITPVQAIVRFFTRGKGQCKIQSDFEGLIKILSLLPDCDWYQDPAIYTDGETKRRAVIRERGKPWMTTEILSQEDVTEQYLKPLLGETFNVAEFLQRLVEGGLTPEEGAKALEQQYQLIKHGGDRRSPQAKENQADIVSMKHGNQAAYLQARLRRDAPEVADALERGEHHSVRAAAIEAGIIKPVPTVRLVDDMAVVAGKLCQHLTQQQRIQLIDLLAPDL
jgi:hypothetical protein